MAPKTFWNNDEVLSEEAIKFDKSSQNEKSELQGYRTKGILEDKDLTQFKSIIDKSTLSADLKDALELLVYRILTAPSVNAVCPFYSNTPLDREDFYRRAVAKGYDIKKYPKFTGLRVKYEGQDFPGFTAIYFPSGAVNCVGVKSTDNLNLIQNILENAARDLFPENTKYILTKRKVCNRVIALQVPSKIQLDRLELFMETEYWRDCKYHLEIFPGLIYKVEGYAAKVLYFRTGSVICCGIKSDHQRTQISLIITKKMTKYLELRYPDDATDKL